MSAFSRISLVFIWMGILWSTGDAAQAPSPPKNPCDNFPCGPQEAADCQVVGTSYHCHCKPGYTISANGTCIPEGPCGRYPCGPHSDRCLWFGGEVYRCKCKEGFTENRLQSPTCVEGKGECGQNPCGFGGLCTSNSDGSHNCTCVDGFQHGPSVKGTTCTSTRKISCDMQPCGDDAVGKCVQTASSYFCVCREGTSAMFTEEGMPTCVPDVGYEPCYEGACGDEGQTCSFENGHRSCVCAEGYAPKRVNVWEDERCYRDQQQGAGENTNTGGGKGFLSNNTMLIAGGIAGGVLLLAAIGAGVGYRHYKHSKGKGAAGGENSVDFVGKDAASADGEESDVLIKARNEDWQ